jgi:aspartyl protease family protein
MNDLPRGLKITTVWLLILLGAFLSAQAWERHQRSTRFTAAGGVIEIRRGADGHYHWPGALNGHDVEFLIDTGATARNMLQRLGAALERGDLGKVGGHGLLQVQGLASHFFSSDPRNLVLEDGCNAWHGCRCG